MKHWWKNIVKDYLTFSAKERRGIIIMFSIGTIVYLILSYYPVKKPVVNKDAFQKELADLKISIDSSRGTNGYDYEDRNADYARPNNYGYPNEAHGAVFAFNPNTLSAEGWKKLGIRDRTINTIHNFLAKGYKFRQAEDIRKIYGLRKEDADRLIPYVQIPGENVAPSNAYTGGGNPSVSPPPVAINRARVIDINSADTSAFISLPGIGSKLASRIVNFRQKLGGFSSVNQLAETYGVPDSTFQRIKPRLACNPASVRKLNINSADVSELRNHPYLKWNIANAIVNYRMQHGNYKSIEDLRKIDIITDDLFNKIAPYLIV